MLFNESDPNKDSGNAPHTVKDKQMRTDIEYTLYFLNKKSLLLFFSLVNSITYIQIFLILAK